MSACLRVAIALGLLSACGDADRPASLGDAGPRDTSVIDVPVECVGDPQCDDGVACTVDTCTAGRCVRSARADRCPAGSACDAVRGCLPRRACTRDGDCRDDDPCTFNERCDPAGGFCAFATQPDGVTCGDPAQSRSCRGGLCVCPASRSTTCGARCVDLQGDPDHCGACDNSCGAGAWCDQGRCACSAPQSWCARAGCVDLTRDTGNCGACGRACEATARCEQGRCRTPCGPNTHRCNETCVADRLVQNCGTRCEPCPTPANGTATCEGDGPMAVCSFLCSLGFHRCDTRCASNSEVATCGDRCAPCPTPTNGRATCVQQRCDIACDPGFHACDGRCVSDASPATCGSRCAPCPAVENGEATCAAGQCGFTCRTGFRMCNGACTDGTSPLGCGPLCTRCPVPSNGRAVCASDRCGFVCNAGFHACGNTCVSDVSPESCGARCEPCPTPPNGTATCEARTCGFVCGPGFRRTGESCLELPRMVWPPAGSWVTSRRPRFRWSLPAGVAGADPDTDVQVCRDRACSRVVATLSATGGTGIVTTDLPPGLLFWRVRARGAAAEVWPLGVSGPGGSEAPEGVAWGTTADFDGDGYSDLLASAPFQSSPGARAYVLRGTPMGLTTGGRTILETPEPMAQFGFALAPVGDLNGDGFVDVVVGAPASLNNTGRAFVYLGSPTGLGERPITLIDGPDGPEAAFGTSVTGGDFNADGYSDIAIGATRAGGGGRVHVFYGSANGPVTRPSVTLPGPTSDNARFGIAVANAGDLDGDGDAELLVGADGFSSFTGRVFLYTGAPAGISATPRAIEARAGGQFGSGLAGVGDLNGDGLPDFAVGATSLDAGRGQVAIYLGARTAITLPAQQIDGPDDTMADFGHALVGAGDVNGDGFGDLLTAAPRLNDFTGRAYLYRGGPMGLDLAGVQRFDLNGVMRGFFGGALVGARDFDNDGFSDVAISAERAMTLTGFVASYRGSVSGLRPSTTATGDGPVNRFGFSLASRHPQVCGPQG